MWSLGHKPHQDYDNTEASTDIGQQTIIFRTCIWYWIYYRVAIDHHPLVSTIHPLCNDTVQVYTHIQPVVEFNKDTVQC